MADNEKEFRIKITTSADTSGAKQAAADLDTLSPKTKEYIESLKEGGTAADKMSLSHRELHIALAQLGPGFAHVGGIVQYALHNQMLAPVIGIVGAFALWEHRINACVEALGGVELPDNVREQVGQIGALATSWKTVGVAIQEAVDAYGSVDQASNRALARLKEEEEQKKKLLEANKKLELSQATNEAQKAEIENRYEGLSEKNDEEAQFKRLEEKTKRRDDLEASAQKKMAEAATIKLGTPEQEAAIDAGMKAHADAAEQSKKERQKRLDDLYAQKDHIGDPGQQLARFGRLVGRYGLIGAEDDGLDESIALERGGGENEQTVIDRYKSRMEGKAARDERIERRKKLVADAGKEVGEAYKISEGLPDDIVAFQRNIENKRTIAATDSQARGNLADAKMLGSPEGKWALHAAELETAAGSGQANSRQLLELQAMKNQYARAHDALGSAMLSALSSGHDSIKTVTQRVLEMAARIQTVEKQLRNLESPR